MNREQIKAVKAAAERVIELCDGADAELWRFGWSVYIGGTKTSGALRRASMDLTRALAEMRRS